MTDRERAFQKFWAEHWQKFASADYAFLAFAAGGQDALERAAQDKQKLFEAIKPFLECEFDSQGRAVIRVETEQLRALRDAVAKFERRDVK